MKTEIGTIMTTEINYIDHSFMGDNLVQYLYGYDDTRSIQEFLINKIESMLEKKPKYEYVKLRNLYVLSADSLTDLFTGLFANDTEKVNRVMDICLKSDLIVLKDGTEVEHVGDYVNITRIICTCPKGLVTKKISYDGFLTASFKSNVLPRLNVHEDDVFFTSEPDKTNNMKWKYINHKVLPYFVDWMVNVPTKGYFYIIEDTNYNLDKDGIAMVKIGFSSDPIKRIKQFKSNPNIAVGRTSMFKNKQIHIKDEQKLFYHLRMFRRKTEYSTECFMMPFEQAELAINRFLETGSISK